MTDDFGLFPRFERKLRALKSGAVTGDKPFPESFRLEHDGSLEVYYAPMDAIEYRARVVIVGITPDRNTARLAVGSTVRALSEGRCISDALAGAKVHAAFSGFRKQLAAWLDYLELPSHLQLRSSHELWADTGRSLLHATSAVRYPVFVGGENYSGAKPRLMKHPALRRYVFDVLAPELDRIPEALVIPLGRRVDEALGALAEIGRLDPKRCLFGFPHPSGQNGHKTGQWLENRAAIKSATEAWFG